MVLKLVTIEPTETQEQQKFIQLVRLYEHRYPALSLLYAVPNQAARDVTNRARMKAEGMKAGVPDVVLPVARGGYFGWYGELKRIRTGYLTDDQRNYLLDLQAAGYRAGWYRGGEEMWRGLECYLSLPPTHFSVSEYERVQRPIPSSRKESA